MCVFIIGVIVLAACGQKPVHLASPPDGATYAIGPNQVPSFSATVDDNDYNNATLLVRGDLPPGVRCEGGSGTVLFCTYAYTLANGVVSSYSQQTYDLFVVVVRGDYEDSHLVRFVWGTTP